MAKHKPPAPAKPRRRSAGWQVQNAAMSLLSVHRAGWQDQNAATAFFANETIAGSPDGPDFVNHSLNKNKNTNATMQIGPAIDDAALEKAVARLSAELTAALRETAGMILDGIQDIPHLREALGNLAVERVTTEPSRPAALLADVAAGRLDRKPTMEIP